jgi:gliding motility-associated-like protein
MSQYLCLSREILHFVGHCMIISTCMLISKPVFAQQGVGGFCGFDEVYDDLLNVSPEFVKSVQALNSKIYQNGNISNLEHRNVLELPIVVHIVSPPGSLIGQANNLDDYEVIKGLELLNQAFANEGELFSSYGLNTGIRFCLASRTPDGLPSSGIVRVQSALVADQQCPPYSTSKDNANSIKGLSSWDCKEYINIWLVTDLYNSGFGCSLAGFATFPGWICGVDGVMQESRYWNTVAGTRITAHELGHFLGLYHTFQGGCKNDDCAKDGDRICDTPPDNSQAFAPCAINSCATDDPDLPDDSQNFMDYSSCNPYHFTEGQAIRMRQVIEEARVELLSSLGCAPPFDLDLGLLGGYKPADPCGSRFCPQVIVRNRGQEVVSKFDVQVYINGALAGVTEWTGSLSPGKFTTLTLNCIDLPPGSHNAIMVVQAPNGMNDQFAANDTLRFSDILVLEAPVLNLIELDSTRCGQNGRIEVEALGGVPPYMFRIGSMAYQMSSEYYPMEQGQYTIFVQDANGCISALSVEIPDACPPCISGVVNFYSPVVSFCDEGVLEVLDPGGFKVGDRILIHQAQGAVVNETNTSLSGVIMDPGYAGNYEFNVIRRIQGETVTLEYKMLNDYDVSGKVQMVTVPDLGDATVCNLTCMPWNGSTGGILAFRGGKVNLSGNIDVSGKGFRGGILTPFFSNQLKTILDYIGQSADDGGMKGEGIAILPQQYQWGRGPWSNGGGGGNNHNAGGAGGGGAGVGGFGGTYLGFPLDTRGIGGFPFAQVDRLIFGGGGGAGHDNNDWGTSGGAGGGIIIMEVNALEAGSSIRIMANGASAAIAGIDGAGGGGGGGSIRINSSVISSSIIFEATGGKGGDNNSEPNPYQCVGTGGGGGGGLVLSSQNLSNVFITGGMAGIVTNNATHSTCIGKPIDGYASSGGSGVVLSGLQTQESFHPYLPLWIEYIDLIGGCDSMLYEIGVGGSSADIEISVNNGPFSATNIVKFAAEGLYLVSIKSGCARKDTLIYFNSSPSLELELIHLMPIGCSNQFGTAIVQASGGVPPYSYKLNNDPWQTENLFDGLNQGQHFLQVMDGAGCTRSLSFNILSVSSGFSLGVDSAMLLWSCIDTSTFISVRPEGDQVYVFFRINGGEYQPYGIFSGMPPGIYVIEAQDEHGCHSEPLYFEVLDVRDTIHIDQIVIICEGEKLNVGSSQYDRSGQYFDKLVSMAGCDSLVHTDLTVYSKQNSELLARLCYGDTVYVAGQSLSSSGIYNIILVDQYGCDSLVKVTILSEDDKLCDSLYCRVYIPNVFSPNNDGINDIFIPSSPVIRFTELRIFDRWGGLLFQQVNANPYWDGYVGSKAADPGVYVYILSGTCGNGKEIFYKGDVTLMK